MPTNNNRSAQELIGDMLKGSSMTLSAAESCTGGRISHLITTVSGSSGYYLGSVTSYAIAVKKNVLGVPAQVIAENGVVSSQVAASMAEGVRRLTGSTFAVATTGLAEGGNEVYPEGTVWIAVTGPVGTETRIHQCNHGRKGNIKEFTRAAMVFLAEYISKYINN